MNTAVAADRVAEASPRLMARMAGLSYLLTILAGVFAQGFVSDKLVVFGDAAATATNILMHKSLFQWGFTVYLIEMECQITSTALFYFLLKPVSRSARCSRRSSALPAARSRRLAAFSTSLPCSF